jgi:hypothetical protein
MVKISAGVTVKVATVEPPSPAHAGTARSPDAPTAVTVTDVTPDGTVNVWAPPVNENVKVVVHTLVEPHAHVRPNGQS